MKLSFCAVALAVIAFPSVASAQSTTYIDYNYAIEAGNVPDGVTSLPVSGPHGIYDLSNPTSYWNQQGPYAFNVTNFALHSSTSGGAASASDPKLTIQDISPADFSSGSWGRTSNTFDGTFSQQYEYFTNSAGLGGATFNFNGLAPGTYNLAVFLYGDGAGRDSLVQVEDSLGDYSGTTAFTHSGAWVQGNSYLSFTNLSVGSDGTLLFEVAQPGPGVEADFNGFQLEQVIQAAPEPSTWALLAAGLGLLVVVSRKRLRQV